MNSRQSEIKASSIPAVMSAMDGCTAAEVSGGPTHLTHLSGDRTHFPGDPTHFPGDPTHLPLLLPLLFLTRSLPGFQLP